MSTRELAGKCGLYCGACAIYRAERDDWEWRKRIADRVKCDAERVRCNGCGGLTTECWGNECKIVLCTRAKGYDYCFECPDYENKSCEYYENLAKDYFEDGEDIRRNLLMVKEGKIDEWLEEAQKQFSCKSCSRPLAAGSKRCHHCGCDLT